MADMTATGFEELEKKEKAERVTIKFFRDFQGHFFQVTVYRGEAPIADGGVKDRKETFGSENAAAIALYLGALTDLRIWKSLLELGRRELAIIGDDTIEYWFSMEPIDYARLVDTAKAYMQKVMCK